MPEKQDPLEQFKLSLQDVIVVVEKLSTHCESFQEMVGLMKLALDNDAMLKILLKEVTSKK